MCSCSNIQEMRARHKDAFLKKHNLKLGLMSAFVKASAFALQEQPVVNAGEFGGQNQQRSWMYVCKYRNTPPHSTHKNGGPLTEASYFRCVRT